MPVTIRTAPTVARTRDIRIRRAAEHDLELISALFRPAHDLPRLRWLVTDPERPGSLRSFVAVEGGRVVGHVSYTLSRFHTPRGELTGVFCGNWIVDPSCRGLGIGSRLFEATFPLADFSYEYGGTEASHRIFYDLQFEQPFDLAHFVKVLRPLAYARILGTRGPKRIAKALALAGLSRTGCRPWRTGARDLALAPYDPGALREKALPPCIANVTPAAQIAWYLSCPGVRSTAFTITANGTPIGTALCLIRDHPAGTRTGRIVHLSHLGEDVASWRRAIALTEAWLDEQGCAMVSAFASCPEFLTALGDRGFRPGWRNPFWLRDHHHGLPRTGWHLTGLEGDVGDRGF